MNPLQFTVESLTEFLHGVYPQTAALIQIEALAPMESVLQMKIDEDSLRPGGTVSGPAMFTIADCAFYCALLAVIGPESLAVTSNLSINFLRKPDPVDLVGHARILKLGRHLAMGDCTIYSKGDDQPVAHASITYSIPHNNA